MIAVSVNDLSLRFGVKSVLEKVSFSLNEGDKLGIIGVNGCGKSSLFKLILGEYEPDEGNVFISKDKSVGVLRQDEAFLASELCGDSVLEQMYAAFPELVRDETRLSELESMLSAKDKHDEAEIGSLSHEYTELYRKFVSEGGMEFRNRCVSVLQKLGFDDSDRARSVATLSGGQRTRLALAKQLCHEPDILMLDEPTNHLDIETAGWLENFLVQYKKTVLVISHDRYFLDKVTNKTLHIENCRAKLYNGGYTKSMEQRKLDREIWEKHYEIQQREIARLEAYIAMQRRWNRERNIIAAESREKAIARIKKIDKPSVEARSVKMSFSASGESGNDVVNVKNAAVAFGEKRIFENVSFLVKKRERVFITGSNGCGKSTLIKLIAGVGAPSSGRVEIGYNVTVGYYDQENQNLTPENTVLEEIWSAYPEVTETEVRGVLAMFLFRGDDVMKQIKVLSGGEKARLTLAKLILSKMNLLLLDEPTNHLDINSREALEEALQKFEGTIIAVSHDRYFISKLATRIIGLSPAGVDDYRMNENGGGYDEYREYMISKSEKTEVGNSREINKGKEEYFKNKKEASDRRKEQKRIENLKNEASRLENELVLIEKELYGEAAADYLRASELEQKKNETEERLLEIYEQLDD